MFEKAEKRNATQKAIKFLDKAEEIDPLNPKVRVARERLVWQIIKKHLEQCKYNLVEQDLKQINLAGLSPIKKALFASIPRFTQLVTSANDPGSGEIDPVLSTLLMHHLYTRSKFNQKTLQKTLPLPEMDTASKLEVYYNLRDALGSIDEIPLLPMDWFNRFPEWIMQAEPISQELLLRISRNILKKGYPPVVLAATAKGLKMDNARHHEFLYYRAHGLIASSYSNFDYARECLLASLTLCRAKGDYEFSHQVLDYFNKIFPSGFNFTFSDKQDSSIKDLPDKEIKRIITREILRTENSFRKNQKKPSSPKKTKSKRKSVDEEQNILW